MPLEEGCWWGGLWYRRGQTAEEKHLYNSRPWGLRAVLPMLFFLFCCIKSSVQHPVPSRLTAGASCPAQPGNFPLLLG